MPEESPNIPQRRADTVPLSAEEKHTVVARMNALTGRPHDFVTEIARQATDARGRLDDDVYGIVRVTLEALAENHGTPPPLVFAVTHHQTGEVKQVGFLPPGVRNIARGGKFETNDPRFRAAGRLEPPPTQLPPTGESDG